MYALDRQSGDLLRKYPTGGVVSQACASTDDFVVAGSQDKHLYVIDARTGVQLWNYEMPGRVKTNPVIYGNYIVVAAEKQYVLAFKWHQKSDEMTELQHED